MEHSLDDDFTLGYNVTLTNAQLSDPMGRELSVTPYNGVVHVVG